LSPKWILFLSKLGIEASHWSAVGVANATDREITEYARQHDLIVLTNDLDFGSILAATNGEKPSVVQVRSAELRPEVIGGSVVSAIRQVEEELKRGALLTIDPNKSRLRLLPLTIP
jgi:predicted nuclease of predicted toxin-antitoxin system